MSSEAYKQAGVDIAAGNALVEGIKPAAASTKRAGVMSGLGGFGGLFDLKAAGYDDPILVAATDGVGTKLRIAIEVGEYSTLGQDLVAMCVNDLIVQGAEPLFFLDYFASSKLDVAAAQALIEGIARACKACNCALIGGETAELPGLYQPGDFDLAGFCVGAVDRAKVLPAMDAVKPGDALIGLSSTGIHSNGFSLARKLVTDAGLTYQSASPFSDHGSLGLALLEPTKLYVLSCIEAIKTGQVKALSHITGGGLLENLPRVLPQTMGADIDGSSWTKPAVFGWMAGLTTDMTQQDWLTTFNCGIGMVLIAEADQAQALVATLNAAGEKAQVIGQVSDQTGVRVHDFSPN